MVPRRYGVTQVEQRRLGPFACEVFRDLFCTFCTALIAHRGENDRIMGYSIRTDRFRYTEWQEAWKSPTPKVVARELYDHEADPRETVNVVDDPANVETVKKLAAQLKAGWKNS